jgi:hypothetical protein
MIIPAAIKPILGVMAATPKGGVVPRTLPGGAHVRPEYLRKGRRHILNQPNRVPFGTASVAGHSGVAGDVPRSDGLNKGERRHRGVSLRQVGRRTRSQASALISQ